MKAFNECNCSDSFVKVDGGVYTITPFPLKDYVLLSSSSLRVLRVFAVRSIQILQVGRE
jgi:hypothetical protein